MFRKLAVERQKKHTQESFSKQFMKNVQQASPADLQKRMLKSQYMIIYLR